MLFLLFFAAHFGLAYVVGFSGISLPFRTWFATKGTVGAFFVQLLECPACFGFWAGLLSAVLVPQQVFLSGAFNGALVTSVLHALLLGFAVAGINMATALLTGLVTSPHKAKLEQLKSAELDLEAEIANAQLSGGLAPSSTEAQMLQLSKMGHAPMGSLEELAKKESAADDKMEEEMSL